MKLFPSIDISEGKVVKRVRGVRGTGLVVGNPREVARRWVEEGAEGLHVVDLDAASIGKLVNFDKVKEVLQEAKGLWVQVAGGIRSVEDAKKYIDAGASAVVIGTKAATDPSFLDLLDREIGGDKVIVAIDNKGGKIAIKGWEVEALSLDEYLKILERRPFSYVLYTYIPAEGTLKGIDLKGVRMVKRLGKEVEYAGGIGSIEDLIKLKEEGVYAAILGMALYSGKIKLREAIKAVR